MARRVQHSYQAATDLIQAQLSQEKSQALYGSAKVPFDHLDFSQPSIRELDDANVDRLVSNFQLAGCLRLETRHHIPAIVDHVLLSHSLTAAGACPDDIKSDNPARWPILNFPDTVKLKCLHGQHRVAAGRRSLHKNDQWWVVDLYCSSMSTQLRTSLVQQTASEIPLSAGQIYFKILRSDSEQPEDTDHWLAQIQTRNSYADVRRLHGRHDLNDAFALLADIPAFGSSMQVGNIGKMMKVKCDEEILHYLSCIHQTWLSLLDGDTSALVKIDRRTIEQLQSRCPAYCRRDRTILEPMIETGEIFGAFDLAARRAIWQRLLVHQGLVPSLQTFFHDLKYLSALADCVVMLVTLERRQSVREAFKKAFVYRDPGIPSPADFDSSYRQIWLFAMCHLDKLCPGSLRVERKCRSETQQKNPRVEYRFAQEAYRLGFRSLRIDTMLSALPDRTEARNTLLRARPSEYFTYDSERFEQYVDHIVAIYAEAQPATTTASSPQLIVDGSGESDVSRRSGRPYTRAFEESAKFMTLQNMDVKEPSDTGGLTAFYIRRHVYLLFFGQRDGPELRGSGMGTDFASHDKAPSRAFELLRSFFSKG